MKKFILNAILFVLLIFSFAYLLDGVINKGLRKMGDYRFMSWNQMIHNKVNADIIINGNSRGLSHFNPKFLDSILNCNSYNLGIGGYPFRMQVLKYNLYLKYNINPKIIIQNVDFVTLNKSDFFGHEREQVFPFVFEPYLQKELIGMGFKWYELYLPYIRYFGYQSVIKNGLFQYFHFKNYNEQASSKGFYPEKGNWNSSELEKVQKIEFKKERTATYLFEQYLASCSKEKIKVVLVNSPIYYKASDKLINRNEMNDYYSSVAKKYGHVYLDYTVDPLCYDTTNFAVAVHLNQLGSTKFSIKLANDLNSMKIFARD
jgi:hypothetical protein